MLPNQCVNCGDYCWRYGFHPNNVDGVTEKVAACLFVIPDDKREESENEQWRSRDLYLAWVKSVKRFRVDTRLIAFVNSFRSVSNQLQVSREESGMVAYGETSDATVSSFTRIVTAACLQKLAKLLKNVWAANITFNCWKHQITPYLSLSLQMFWKGCLSNLHLISLPMFKCHTSENMTNVPIKFFSVLNVHKLDTNGRFLIFGIFQWWLQEHEHSNS